MKIGNVIHEKELVNHTKVDYVNYYNKPLAYGDIDQTLPTLYVGWSFMKNCNPTNPLFQDADILKKKIVNNDLYWELSFQESKASHIKGVDKFVGLAPDFYFSSKYTYTNLDPVFLQLKEFQDLLNVCPIEIHRGYKYKDEMLYLLHDNNIYGINLKMFDFFQFNTKDIVLKIDARTKSTINDIDGSYYQRYYKILPKFTHLKRYLVTI